MRNVLSLTIVLLLVVAVSAWAQIPKLINYQAKLTDGDGVALNGDYDITFKVYDEETGGTPLWTEAHTGVTVTNGLFDVQLGTITDLDLSFADTYWVEITIGTETLTPREMLSTVPYAFRALVAESAGGVQDVGVEMTTLSDFNYITSTDAHGAFDELDEQIYTNTGNIADNAADIIDLDSRVTTNEGNIATNAADIADLDARVTTNEDDIADNAADIANNAADIANNAADIGNLDSRVTTNEGNIATNALAIADLDSRVTINEADIANNAADIIDLDSRVTTNEADIANNAADIAALDARVTINEGAIAANVAAIAVNGVSIDSLASAIGSYGGHTVIDYSSNYYVVDGTDLITAIGALDNGLNSVATGYVQTIVGTPNRISVTHVTDTKDSIDIASNYVGQTSITTLGTITTGTWQANVIGVPYGGTGLSSVTANYLLYGNGTGALQTLAPSTGYLKWTGSAYAWAHGYDDNANHIAGNGLEGADYNGSAEVTWNVKNADASIDVAADGISVQLDGPSLETTADGLRVANGQAKMTGTGYQLYRNY